MTYAAYVYASRLCFSVRSHVSVTLWGCRCYRLQLCGMKVLCKGLEDSSPKHIAYNIMILRGVGRDPVHSMCIAQYDEQWITTCCLVPPVSIVLMTFSASTLPVAYKV